MNDQPERSEAFHKRCANLMSAVPASEVAQLRKDADRLNHLESLVTKWANHEGTCPPAMRLLEFDYFAEQTLRDAIDEAMNQTAP